MVRQILGAVSQFEKAGPVAKLKHGRDAKRAATGRCEGHRPVQVPQDRAAAKPASHRGRAGRARTSRPVRTALPRQQHPPHAGRLGSRATPPTRGSIAVLPDKSALTWTADGSTSGDYFFTPAQ